MNKLINQRIIKKDTKVNEYELKFYCCRKDDYINFVILTFQYPIQFTSKDVKQIENTFVKNCKYTDIFVGLK